MLEKFGEEGLITHVVSLNIKIRFHPELYRFQLNLQIGNHRYLDLGIIKVELLRPNVDVKRLAYTC